MMFPMISIGSTLASVVSKALPDVFITIFYAIIMTGLLVFNIFRLVALIRKEMTPAAAKPTEAAAPTPAELPPINSKEDSSENAR